MASLVIGIDGGASSTTALLAEGETGRVLGRGAGGPSNIQAVGETAALRELNSAVAAAFAAAQLPRAAVAAASLGLAGIDIDGTDVIRGWSSLVGLAGKISIGNDATLLFAAGTPEAGEWPSSPAPVPSHLRSTATARSPAPAVGAT